ncbi:MAG: cohesin domain-containing protein [Candidatus Uhrbacteria bacterium]|nr:cohesin domain-containing protein [Candidatus Uhrbacteria bacterium]
MKKIAILFLGLAMSIAGVGSSTALAAGSATLTLSPTNTSVETGDNFSLSVMVTPNGESLDTARVELDWDASKLEVLSFDLGSLFPYLSPSNEIDNINGDLSYGAYKSGTAVTSSGTIATVTFRALASGSTTISVLSSSKLISDGEEKISTSTLGSSAITVSGEAVVEEEEEEEVSYVDENLSLEQQGLVYFGAFYARMPSNGNDWSALHCIAYGGCQGNPRDLGAEEHALILFGQKYAKMPATNMEWNVLHTIAYTDLLTWDEQGSEEDVMEEEVIEEEVMEEETELTLEEQAIGWFGKITGYLPSSDADWTAIDYMVNGYTPEMQDLEAESAAITTFVSVFGSLPSSDSDWNIIAAIAYSGAF